MKGRRLTIILVMLLVLVCALAFVGCEKDPEPTPTPTPTPEHTHVAFLVEAKEATCTEEGNNAYYLCACGAAFKDEAMTIPTYDYAEVIARKEHVYNKTEVNRETLKDAATCQSAATYYYSCVCGAVDSSENANTFTFGDKAAHNTVFVPAVSATCETEGNIAYYTCETCKAAFKDAQATQQFGVTETVVVPAEGHTAVAHEKVEATCAEPGVAAYWSCSVCSKLFSDAECTNVITTANRAIPKLGHDFSVELPIAKYQASEATCIESATYYRSCSRCGESGTATFAYGEKAAHTPEAVAAKEPTCTENGNEAYYACKVCSAMFSDPACQTAIEADDVTIEKLGHKYDREVADAAYLKTPATCLTQAVYYKSCVCGNFSEETFSAGEYGAHVLTEEGFHNSVAATCETDGSVAYFTCAVCNKDCNLDGKEMAQASDKVVPALGHDFAEIADADHLISPATCTSPAIYKKVCTRCDAVGSETFERGEKLGHVFEEWTERKEPTCEDDGNVRYRRCSSCQKYYDEFETEIADVVIAKLGHNFNDKVVDDKYLATAATCTAPAQYYRSCTRCNKSSKDDPSLTAQLVFEVGEALGHDIGDIVAKTNPDCVNEGMEAHYECKRCSAYFDLDKKDAKREDFVIASLGHDNTAKVVSEIYFVSAANCESAAKYYLSCTRCQIASTETFDVGEALGHTYGNIISKVDASCETDGMDAHYVCSVCNKMFDADKVEKQESELVIAKLGHDYTRNVVNDAYVKSTATCTAAAVYYYSCYHCNATSKGTEYESTFTAGTTAAHVYGDWTLEKEPTCTEDGNIKYRTCSTCNQNFDTEGNIVEKVAIDKLGHNYTRGVVHDNYLKTTATCQAAAVYYYSCYNCNTSSKGTEYESTFTAGTTAPHTYGDWTLSKEPTCTEDGNIKYRTCTVCSQNFDINNEAVTTTVVAKLGHECTAKVVDAKYLASAANCVDAAKYYCSCVRCGAAGTETFAEGDALGHTYGNLVAKVEPNCETTGMEAHYVCTVCNALFDTDKVERNEAELVIAKLGHECTAKAVDAKYLAAAANCVDAAKYYYSCVRCGAAGTETFAEGEALGHTYGNIVSKVEAKCETDGMEAHYVCTVCNALFDTDKVERKESELVIAKLGHDYSREVVHDDYVKSAATCTAAAVYYYSCSHCNSSSKGTEYEATFTAGTTAAHVYGDWTLEKEPTCTEDGNIKYRTCSTCNQNFDTEGKIVEKVTIDKLGHDYTRNVVHDDYVKSVATCTAAAVYYYSCRHCNTSSKGTEYESTFEAGTTAPHTYGDWTAAVAPTCTEDGNIKYRTCTVCNQNFDVNNNMVTTVVDAKLGHEYSAKLLDSKYLVSEADCEHAAKYYYSCVRCGVAGTETFEEGDALGHTYGTLVAKVEPTCVTEGTIAHYTCSVCNKNFDENKNEVSDLVIARTLPTVAVGNYDLDTGVFTEGGVTYSVKLVNGVYVISGIIEKSGAYANRTDAYKYFVRFSGEFLSAYANVGNDEIVIKIKSLYGETNTSAAEYEGYNVFTKAAFEADGSLVYIGSGTAHGVVEILFKNPVGDGWYGYKVMVDDSTICPEKVEAAEPSYFATGNVEYYASMRDDRVFFLVDGKYEETSMEKIILVSYPNADAGSLDSNGKYMPGRYENGDAIQYNVKRNGGAYEINGLLKYDANTKNYPYVIRFDANFAEYYEKLADNTIVLKYAYADGTVYASFTKADAFANDYAFIFRGDALKGDAQCLFLNPFAEGEVWVSYQVKIGADAVCPKEVTASDASYWYAGWDTYYVNALYSGDKYYEDAACTKEIAAEKVFVKEKLVISGMTAGIYAQVGTDGDKPVYGYQVSESYRVALVNGVYTVFGSIACNNDRSDLSAAKIVVRIDGNFRQFYRVVSNDVVIVRLTIGENVVEITKGDVVFADGGEIVIISALERGQTLTVELINPMTEQFGDLSYTIALDADATYVHNMVVRHAIAATYWTEGCTEYVECADCGKQVGYQVVEKLVPTMTPVITDEAHAYTVTYGEGKYVISGNPKFDLPGDGLEAGYRVKIKFGCSFGNAYDEFADDDVIIVIKVGTTEYKLTKADLDADGGFTLTLNVTDGMEFSITFVNPDSEGSDAVYSFVVKLDA